MFSGKVSVYKLSKPRYPENAPFHPSQPYPEYGFSSLSQEENFVYEGVREVLRLSGLDKNRYGSEEWNPLGEYIKPGQKVLLKPNLVKEKHPRDPEGWKYVLTHGSVIRAVADFVWKALDGKGKIILADAPQTDSSFTEIAKVLELGSIADFYTSMGLDFELRDLRKEEWLAREGVVVERKELAGDPEGYIAYNLGEASEFFGHCGEGRYYGADYDAKVVNSHHSDGKHEYLISGTAIDCDVFINLPKMKTHKKAGVTLSLKNLVGINGDKNWLPHHTEGTPQFGGDEVPEAPLKHRLERKGVALFRKLALAFPGFGPWFYQKIRKKAVAVLGDTEEVIRSGNWWGNDTVWRMCLDLNKILLFGEMDGSLKTPSCNDPKTHLVFLDGVIAGQGRGPMNPDPAAVGILLFGTNPAEADAVATVLMGFDPNKIPIVRQSFEIRGYRIGQGPWERIPVVSNCLGWQAALGEISVFSCFEPHFGWKGHIERKLL